MCRPKNAIATYLKNIADFVLGTLCTLLVGFAIAYGQRALFDESLAELASASRKLGMIGRTRSHSSDAAGSAGRRLVVDQSRFYEAGS